LFEEIDDLDRFDLIYFDAFGYRVQPDLWSTAIFKKMFDAKTMGFSYLCCSWCCEKGMIE
jgi:tRNA U34 5-methylaminomethyl-2-thiouridine-forming methyltransferase MnmC